MNSSRSQTTVGQIIWIAANHILASSLITRTDNKGSNVQKGLMMMLKALINDWSWLIRIIYANRVNFFSGGSNDSWRGPGLAQGAGEGK